MSDKRQVLRDNSDDSEEDSNYEIQFESDSSEFESKSSEDIQGSTDEGDTTRYTDFPHQITNDFSFDIITANVFVYITVVVICQNIFASYQPLDTEELLKSVGCLLWMGLVHMPKIRDYWSTICYLSIM
ncbi:hypothetical protein PGB90_006226 [Kerria lacca]